MTLIWRFFTANNPSKGLGAGLWSVLAVDKLINPLFHHGSFFFQVVGAPTKHALVVLSGVLLVGVGATVIGVVRRQTFAADLGLASLLGFAAVIVSVSRVVGPLLGYLVLFAIALPVAALIGLGVSLLGDKQDGARPQEHTHTSSGRRSGWGLATGILALLAVLVIMACCLRVANGPPLKTASFPDVAKVWMDVSTHLKPSRQDIYVAESGPTSLQELSISWGLFDELQEHGYHPRVMQSWKWVVGGRYVSSDHERIHVLLYLPTLPVKGMSGFVGQTPDVDVVITKSSQPRP
jgi:hypothetical protein